MAWDEEKSEKAASYFLEEVRVLASADPVIDAAMHSLAVAIKSHLRETGYKQMMRKFLAEFAD